MCSQSEKSTEFSELSFVILKLSFLSRFPTYRKSCKSLFLFSTFISFHFIYHIVSFVVYLVEPNLSSSYISELRSSAFCHSYSTSCKQISWLANKVNDHRHFHTLILQIFSGCCLHQAFTNWPTILAKNHLNTYACPFPSAMLRCAWLQSYEATTTLQKVVGKPKGAKFSTLTHGYCPIL